MRKPPLSFRAVFIAVMGACLFHISVWGGDAESWETRNRGKVSPVCLKEAKGHVAVLEKGGKGVENARKGLDQLIASGCGDSLVKARLGLSLLDEDSDKAKSFLEASSASLAMEYPALVALRMALMFNLAYLLEKQGDFDSAEKYYRDVLVLDENYANARTSLVSLYQKRAKRLEQAGNVDDAFRDISLAISEIEIAEQQSGARSKVVREQLLIAAASLLGRAHRAPEAWLYIEELLKEKNTKALMKIAEVFGSTDQRHEQGRVYQRILEVKPLAVEAIAALGDLYEQEGRNDEAEAMYRKALESSPELSRVRYLLGVMRFNRGNFSEGLELIEQAAREVPDSAEYRETLEEMRASITK